MTDIADRTERWSLRVAYNSIFRKIFGYRHFESVTNLQHALGRHTWEELIERQKMALLLEQEDAMRILLSDYSATEYSCTHCFSHWHVNNYLFISYCTYLL